MNQIVDIPLSEAPPEAELARDVCDDRGNCLVTAGARLTPKIVERLRSREVKTVPVLLKVELSAEQVAVRRKEIEEQLDSRFRQVAADPLMVKFKSILLAYRLRELE